MEKLALIEAVRNPLILQMFPMFQVEELRITKQEQTYLPAIFCEIAGMSVSEVRPIEKVGRVMKFSVTPYKSPDPDILYCPVGRFKEYYSTWRNILAYKNNWSGYFNVDKVKLWGDMMQNVVARNLQYLTEQEMAYFIIEGLKFKNEVVMR